MTAGNSIAPALLCPLCAYNLTGLTDPRCPECGHTFEWAELTDPARQNLRWLFEHRRWLRGYLSTHLYLLWPPRFFRTLRPVHRISRLRILIFFILGWAPLALLLSPAPKYAFVTVALLDQSRDIRATAARKPTEIARIRAIMPRMEFPKDPTGMSDGEVLDWVAPYPWHREFASNIQQFYQLAFVYPSSGSQTRLSPVWPAIGMIAACLAATSLLFAVLRASRRRVRATPVHVLRVVAYCFDGLIVSIGALALGFVQLSRERVWSMSISNASAFSRALSNFDETLWQITLAFVAIILFRLGFALRRYLLIPHAIGVVAATFVIAVLLFVLGLLATGA